MPNFFLDPLKTLASYEKLIKDIENRNSPIATNGIIDENIGHIVYGLREHTGRQMLLITYDEVKGQKLYEDIKNFGEENVVLFPKKEVLFYDVEAFSYERSNQRLNVVSRLMEGEDLIVIAHIDAILDKLLNPNLFKKHTQLIKFGDTVDLNKITEIFISSGYERINMVEGVGQFSIRGGILDFFPPNSENPYRVELFDDEVDSIRTFDIRTQRSLEIVDYVFIPPVKEILILEDYREEIVKNLEKDLKRVNSKMKENSIEKQNIEEKFNKYVEALKENLYISNRDMILPFIPKEYLSNLINYFKEDSLIFIDEPKRVEEKVKNIKDEFNLKFTDLYEVGAVLPSHVNISYDYKDILDDIKNKICITNSALLKGNATLSPKSILNFSTKSMQSYHNKMEFLIEELNHYKYRGYKVVILSGTEERGKRLHSSLLDLGMETIFVEDKNKEIKSSQVYITSGSINGGFEYPAIKFVVISDKEIFGAAKKKARKFIKKDQEKIVSFSDLNVGDYVVHENHGIGQYEGVEQLDIQGIKKDYLTIRYKGQDKLYVPIDQMNLIQKYIGSDSIKPKVNRLSSAEWSKTKAKAKKAVEDMAKDLLELYAKRHNLKGYGFSKDSTWQRQFEDLFPYEETDAQLKSIIEIKKDMEKSKPMDRLLCGDVGYGKTEVALRAAFKAVMDGKQVAFLVPTTILAQQHYNTLMERFDTFPVKVAMLSRFRTPAEQKIAIEGIRKGTIDVAVGTHRLLSKDVEFKDLGLLIIDEEQRFGVKHKETLKKLKETVDVLTLTATPIPRTLHMSMVGIRDMSIIDEPPEERYPVQTYVVENNDQMIRDAILKEIGRGGQIYFVYNRVETIDKITSRLRALVPEATFAIGHGQMGERELEKVMMNFLNKEYDVLVCTTIIETGLDIPNVNTIIIYDADKMGLSQLYQLKGRVGRSNRIAYAYFTYEKNKVLSEVAEKRLRAIKDFTEFGSGFKIAMRDLEIRGAGNLLGLEQHGHIEAIGYDLYVKFLHETIRRLQGEVVEETLDTTIDLRVDGFIPVKYIEDEEQKIEVYKKIAAVESIDDYGELIDELIDRFGDVPKEVENLMDISYIKNLASKNHIKNIGQLEKEVVLEFISTENMSLELLHYLSKKYGRKITFDLSTSPSFRFRVKENILESLKELVEKINGFHKNENNI
ncbi:transcription-repair coupling factor [Tissierella sp. MSJ-40]|uniref:Transcription-repair-coupling factor n=1 Tax=Tissierella simiarum TaxID=2841534 RepID=A0ABS6E937_9FIRM|nr:transcription-repair coupling factor [Tissierella simiarum]MBU5439287.1 transcription-repair coupling factor [Tissierella simiarum]